MNLEKLYKTKDYNEIPTVAGVYIFRDKDKKVLYVGKAINLKNRVKSYFKNKSSLDLKTQSLVEKINEINYITVENELEALLLEADLIKRYKPPYNINLKDDKFYKYIKIEKDRITTTRKPKNEKGVRYLGPYPEGKNITTILKFLRKVFPYRDCTNTKFNKYKRLKRPCLYGHIGLCAAPCISEKGKEINQQNIENIYKYIKGDRVRLFKNLERKMLEYAKNQQFEEAAIIRDQIFSYEYLTQSKHNVENYISEPALLKNERVNGLIELIKVLYECSNKKYFSELGKTLYSDSTNEEINTAISQFRIETYDISNFQGKYAVGSMVVTIGGFPSKDKYRRFKIKTKDTPDDFSMMKEVLLRRFSEQNIKKWGIPNLIVIDGGKGQLSVAKGVLSILKINIPIISLAKRYEEILLSNMFDSIKEARDHTKSLLNKGSLPIKNILVEDNFITIKLNLNSPSLKIIMMNIKRPLQLVISNTIGLFVATLILEGFYVEKKLYVFVLGATFLMLGQLIVRPILRFISFPINMITLGLFNFVINSAILFGVIYLTSGISVNAGFINTIDVPFYGKVATTIELDKWVTLFVAALIIDIVNWLMKKFVF